METKITTGSSNVFVRTDDGDVPFEQFQPYTYHRGDCGKFSRSSDTQDEFQVENDCTCGLAELYGGNPCPCHSCEHHRCPA